MNQSERAIAKVDDLQPGEMKEISVGDDQSILLVRVGDNFYATGAKCTHYGAPLVTGIVSGDRLICPWHNACFNATCGKMVEPPALDDLPSFPVRVEGGQIFATLPDQIPELVTPQMATPDASDSRVMAIIGAGAAGNMAAQTLRQEGYKGKIVMISREEKLPYDRTKLSKSYLQQSKPNEDSLPLRSCEFYQEHEIDLKFGQEVTAVDPKAKTITFEDGSTMNYDKLLLATGGKPRQLNIPGSDLDNVFTLRQPEDANEIIKTAGGVKRAVVVGSSFIGMEVASSLTQQGIEVTVVSPDEIPFAKILGREIGRLFQQVHVDKGVTFRLGHKLEKIEGDGRVEAAILDNGDRLQCDLVVAGIGVSPVTDYLQGIELNEKDHSIEVDEYLQAAEDLYAAGDIARFPYPPLGKTTRIEHWRLAQQHGQIAAKNMLGQQVAMTGVPYFWTGQFDIKLRYAGHATDWDEIIYEGDLDQQEFIAYYVQNNQILAVAGCGKDQKVAEMTELMRQGEMPSPQSVKASQA